MNYVTEDGMKKMIEKLTYLKYTVRKDATDRLNAARKLGDLRENGDYKAAREEMAQLDQKIGELQMLIGESQVLSKDDIGLDVVHKSVKNEDFPGCISPADWFCFIQTPIRGSYAYRGNL